MLVTPAELRRQQALVVSETALRRASCRASPGCARRSRQRPSSPPPSAARRRSRELTKERATAIFLAQRQGRRLARPLPAQGPRHRRDLRADSSKCAAAHRRLLDGQRLVEHGDVDAGEIATGQGRRRARAASPRRGPGRRSRGRWRAATRARSAARRSTACRSGSRFCAVFLLGLARLRRPLSLRNLDLLALLSFSVSLWFFNAATSSRACRSPTRRSSTCSARCVWIGVRGRPCARRARSGRPGCCSAAARLPRRLPRSGSTSSDSNVIDVGYAGVIGAQRIVERRDRRTATSRGGRPEGVRAGRLGGRDPRPDPDERPLRVREPARRHVRAGRVRGVPPGLLDLRLERQVGQAARRAPHVDHLRPALRCSGWGSSACASAAAGSALRSRSRGRRFRSRSTSRCRTRTTRSCPSSSSAGFWLATSPWARGALVALSGWTKFATLHRRAALADLSRTGPRGRVRRSPSPRASLVATLVAFSVLLLEPHPIQAAQTFYERTLKTQIRRESPFSLWDWAQYHARGIPDLHVVQRVLEGAARGRRGRRRRSCRARKTPLQLAALTGALLIGFELVLTHWFYLYIPWFFPFVAFALLWNGPEQPEAGV